MERTDRNRKVFHVHTVIEPAYDWFQVVTGLPEAEWIHRCGEFIENGCDIDGDPRWGDHLYIRHAKTGNRLDAGAFSVWTLNQLQDAMKHIPREVRLRNRAPVVQIWAAGHRSQQFNVDARYLHANLKCLPQIVHARFAFQGMSIDVCWEGEYTQGNVRGICK